MPEDLWIRLFQSRFFDEYLALTCEIVLSLVPIVTLHVTLHVLPL